MDEFKKYLRERRDQMDIDLPAEDTWDKIRKGGKVKRLSVYRMLAAACLLIFIISVVYLNFFKTNRDFANLQVTKSNEPVVLNKPANHVSPVAGGNELPVPVAQNATAVSQVEKLASKRNDHIVYNIHRNKVVKPLKKEESVAETFTDMQKSFAIIINMQLNKVKNTPLYGEDASYFTVFKKEFEDLNTDENNAKQEIIQNGLQDAQIGKLINVYQQKILLLKRLQSEINKVNSHAPKEPAEKTQKPTYINL